jgi:Beta-propeller repeat
MTRYRWARRWHILVATAALFGMVMLGLGLVLRESGSRAQAGPWRAQFGSADHDAATSAAVDESGAVVVVGWTSGALTQAGVSGPKDAFVRKYTASGTASWTSQFGTPGSDTATAVAVAPDGAVYVVGQLAGTTQPGATPFYAFVRKYAADGTEAWTQQFGAEGPSATTTAASVAVDSSGAAYVAGWVFGALPGQTAGGQDDAFVRKYDTNGVEAWTRQAGGPGHDLATTVSVDAAGDVYVAGQREQASNDVGTTAVRKYSPTGVELSARDLGTTGDVTIAVTIGRDGSIYQVGELAPPERIHDHAQGNHRGVPFVRKYDATGPEAWTREFGAGATDAIVNVAVDSTGTVYVAGHTSRGKGRGEPDVRSIAFVRPFGPDGAAGPTRQFASARYATATQVAAGSPGQVFVVGLTRGALPGMTANGPSDAFIGKVQL